MTTYEELLYIQQKYPILTFQNVGYEYVDKKKFTEADTIAFNRATYLLKKCITGFSEFNNFKLRKDGTIVVRVQYYWDERFKGVGYFPLKDFKDVTN